MKKTVILTLMILAYIVASAEPITLKKSARLALPFMFNQLDEPVLVKKAVRKRSLKTASNADTTSPYYIYSRGEGKGFVIVSGDDALPEVLGYTEHGDFDENNLPPFLVWYLDYYGKLIEAAQEAGAERMETPKYASKRIDIAPLIQTHWHQSTPYNNLCPTLKDGGGRAVTGCVATAASQILYYWRKNLPSYTQATVASYTKGDANATQTFAKGTELKWDLMRTEYGTEPSEYREAVATLLAVVGGAAKLTYGSSTSGYTQDIVGVFSTYFGMNGGKCLVKDNGGESNNYSDDAWATLLYNELILSRPIMYSGVNTTNGGHAVVVDGYQASTGYFHFNIGWGSPGTYDGYFTVARGKSPSWGFNDSWQECIIGAYPKSNNLSGSIVVPATIYKNRENTVKIKIKNHGTLPYSGIYLHGNTTGKKPTALGSAKAVDKDTEFSADGTEYVLQLNVKPTSDKYYLFATDNNLNVIASCTINTVEPDNKLILKDFKICGSSDKQDDYTVVYNEKTTAEATLYNKCDVGYDGILRANIYCYDNVNKEARYLTSKTAKVSLPANGEGKAVFNIISSSGCPIVIDSLYNIVLLDETSTDNTPIFIGNGTDSIAKFVLKGADMEIANFTDNCVYFSGKWDPLLFSTIIKKNAYKNATSYDLTNVTKIDEVPESTVNPNALFYVNDKNATGRNVVFNGKCENFYATPGYDFVTREGFEASSATIDIMQIPNKWYLFTAPCDLVVPTGMLARNIESHLSSGINNKTTNVKSLEAGKTYLIITTSSYNQIIYGTNSSIVKAPVSNSDSTLIGTFNKTTTPEGAFLIDMEETQYFQPVESGTIVDALRGYFCPGNIKKAFKVSSSIVQDPTYQTLAETIQETYSIRDLYKDIVFESAYIQITDSIMKAEEIYSAREMSNPSVKQMSSNLKSIATWYVKQITDPSICEIDFTSFIQNPSFETGKTNGWTVEGTNYTSVRQTSNINYKGVGADGNYLLYNLKTSDLTGCGIQQTIQGLPSGYYKLVAMLGSGKEKEITMFANDSIVTINSHPFGQFYLTEAKIENIYVKEGDNLTIGIKAGDWYKADDFRLYYTATDPTGIEPATITELDSDTSVMYDITGRPITNGITSHGIYIMDGKKFLLK